MVAVFGSVLSTLVALVATGLFPPATSRAGVVTSSFPSQALGGPEHYAIYLPDGYAVSGRRYPVVYALVPGLKQAFQTWNPTYLGFYVGAQDWRFEPENVRLHRELVAAGVPHHFAVYPGAHTYALWTPHQRAWIGRAARELAG